MAMLGEAAQPVINEPRSDRRFGQRQRNMCYNACKHLEIKRVNIDKVRFK